MSFSTLIKGLLRLLLLLLLYFLQADVFPHLRVLGVCPLLLPAAAVGFGLFGSGLTGGLWGLAAGLLCDLSLDGSCAFTVLLCCAGFLAGFLGEFVMARGLPSYLLLTAATLFCGVLTRVLPLVFAGVRPVPLLISLGVELGYSLLLALPLYPLLRAFGRSRERRRTE